MSIKSLPFPTPKNKTIGHRGAGKLAPENSLSAFKLAKQLGLSWVEFDTQPCETGEWILMHDDTLDRTSNGSGSIASTSMKSLQKLTIGKDFAAENITNFLEPIPSLSEALETLAALDIHPNIEIKSPFALTGKSLENFLDIVDKHWPKSKALPLISSFDAEILLEIKDRMPILPLGYNIEQLQNDTINRVKESQFFSLHCDYEMLSAENLEELLLEPFPLLLYTVNDPKLAQAYFQKGVWAIFSDNPNLNAKV